MKIVLIPDWLLPMTEGGHYGWNHRGNPYVGRYELIDGVWRVS